MQRSYSSKAIVFSLKPSGENNSTVTLFTPDRGIIYATLYGGPKSRFKSLVNQFNSGTVWLYDTPEKKQTKITDFEVKNYHPSFSQNLFKMFAASLACELCIKTHAAGSPESAFNLLTGFFDGMELCTEEQSRLGLIRFLWRFINLMGIQPDTTECFDCGSSYIKHEIENTFDSYYNKNENIIICNKCFGNRKQAAGENNNFQYIKISNSSLDYLNGISLLKPQEARKLQIDEEGYFQIREFIFFLIENAAGTKLNTLETGMGIL